MHKQYSVIYSGSKVPLFQSKLYDEYEDLILCPMNDLEIMSDMQTGLVENIGNDFNRIQYGPGCNK